MRFCKDVITVLLMAQHTVQTFNSITVDGSTPGAPKTRLS